MSEIKKNDDFKKFVGDRATTYLGKVSKTFLVKRKRPKILSQYSAISTFKGVIENNNLWATHWAFLNDAKELKRGLEAAKQVIADIKQNEKLKTKNQYLWVLEDFISSLTKKEIYNIINVYVLCFSEKKDNLNMWRGYGNGYNSIVIDYNTADLDMNGNTIGIPLIGKINYNEDEQKKMMLMYLMQYCELIEKINEHFPSQKNDAVKYMLGYLIVGIVVLSLFMKEKYWNEEKEWRIIFLNPSDELLDFKETDKGFVPFVKVPIFKNHAIKCIKKIRLPKSENFELREHAMKMLWNKFCTSKNIKKDLEVEQSSISIVY